jgi:hypothetical protein
MKLRRELIDRIAGRMASVLTSEKCLTGVAPPALAARLAIAMTEDLMVEDRLNDEIRDLLRKHSQEMDRERAEYNEMFKKVKAKLVRDRKLIL